LGGCAELEWQGRTIVEALGGRWAATGGMCRCPAHNDNRPSLSVRVGDRNLLFHCFSGCNTTDVLRALRHGGQIEWSRVRTTDLPVKSVAATSAAIINRLWNGGHVVQGTLADRYLRSRGIVAGSAQLRFHPRVQLGKRGDATYHPALLAAVRDEGGVIAVHRTFLDAETGRLANSANPKLMLGRPLTGTVRLGTPQSILGIAEGLETALSASSLLGIPVWAVLGNERFGMISLPRTITTLFVLPDRDAGGARAAKLAQAHQRTGLTIEVLMPPAGANDWNDVALDEALRATIFKCGSSNSGRGESAAPD
jgi:putative DNA primase/helicase